VEWFLKEKIASHLDTKQVKMFRYITLWKPLSLMCDLAIVKPNEFKLDWPIPRRVLSDSGPRTDQGVGEPRFPLTASSS